MERYFNSQQESILLGYNNSQFRRSSSTNPTTPQRNSDEVDFNDVFGGPPRRSSVNETISGEEGSEAGWCRWPSETREKPVFGEDSGVRRRHQNRNNDFFDDIFGGEESPSMCSTPKKRDAVDPFASPSTLLSPARLAIEPLASALPPSFSLPAKLTKGVDLRTFGSLTRSSKQLNVNDNIAASNGLSTSDSHPSRFSTQITQHNGLKNDSKPSYRQSLLSKEFLNSSLSEEADTRTNMKQNTSYGEVSPNSKTSDGQFHFSIYKWASKGVPLAMPLRTDRTSRTKDKLKLEKCSSAKEWIVSEITTENDSPIAYIGSSLTKNEKQDVSTKPDVSSTIKNMAISHQIVERTAFTKAQSDSLSGPQTVIKDVPGSPISSDVRGESSTHSTSETVFNGKIEATSETKKLDSKSLHSLLGESDKKQDYDEMTRMVRGKNMMKSSKKLSSIVDVPLNPKKQDEKQKSVSLRSVGYGKATSQGSLSPSEKNMRKGRVSGKVKEFVQIFNQEAVTKPRVDSKSRLNDTTYKQKGAFRVNNNVEGDPGLSKIEISTIETTTMSANNFPPQDDISASAVPDISFAVTGDKDESFDENFTIQVLEQDENEVLLNQQNQEIQVIDNKIQQWSKGKEGNIRSLLSTLQYVLWSECGWKPVPLMDIIEGNAVKRAYQRALLCLHPDKLQQKGAASDQKYIAEKVFDILQEAWAQFNMVGAL